MYNCSVAGVQSSPTALFSHMRRGCSTTNGQGVQLRRYNQYFVRLDGETRTVDISTELIGYFKIKNSAGNYLTYADQIDSAVSVTAANDSATQIWKIERSSEDNKYHIRPAKYNSHAMNVYRNEIYSCTMNITSNNIADTSFTIEDKGNFSYTIKWQNYNNANTDHYLTERNGKTYWTSNSQQEWILETADYTVIGPGESYEYPRIRYGSNSPYENVNFGSESGYHLNNLKLKQKDDWTGTTLVDHNKSVGEVLRDSGCVLFSYAMVLYALGATVTKYDYRTNKIEEIKADPYSCLMANIGATDDWSEAQSGEITINTDYFYEYPGFGVINSVYGVILSTFGSYYRSKIYLSKLGTMEAAKLNAADITAALIEHPEGVIVRCDNKDHSFVVVGSSYNSSADYADISSIGECFTVYDSSGDNGGTENGGIKFNESWSRSGIYKDRIAPDDFSTLSYYEVIVSY